MEALLYVMSHCIEKPIDEIYSIEPAWHKLEILRPMGITAADVKRLCPKIHEVPVRVEIDGITLEVGEKTLVADYAECRPEIIGNEGRFAVLGSHGEKYGVISNCELYEALKAGVGDAGKIVTAGTLGRGKRAFFSVLLNDGGEFEVKRANGARDAFKAHLNFITSHDGTLAAQAYDSTIRIVCQNTLDWSMQAAGDVGFKVYHTAGSAVAMSKMGELISAVLEGRREFVGAMGELEQLQLSTPQARELATGYFALIGAKMNGGKVEALATRSANAADEITALFSRGKGNGGRTGYDLLNGATEYWTNGDGTGKRASDAKRLSSAAFGTAAEHKVRFVAMLRGNRDAMREAGKEALSLC